MKETLLITGFEPFDGYSINPSAELVKKLDKTQVGQYQIVGRVLPLDYTRALDEIRQYLDEHRPTVILACGQANRGSITLEKIAVNALNTQRGDNYNHIPETDVIITGAPAGYFTNLDVNRLAEILRDNNIPAEVSYHAGTYGCNWLLFNLLHWISSGKLKAIAGFIHVPPLPAQAIEKRLATIPTMPIDMTIHGIKIVIENL